MTVYEAAAQPTLPYTVRTHGYSGWDTTVRGDIRTIGMSGATVGLSDTFMGSTLNPAGMAMTYDGFSLQLSGNQIHNDQIQDYNQTLNATNVGTAATVYPWGFTLGFWSPSNEQQPWRLLDGTEVIPEIFVREFRASVSRVFLDDKLSLGLGLTLGRASKNLDFPNASNLNNSNASYSFGGALGAMYQLPGRVLLGASYNFPQFYPADPIGNPTPGITGFFRPVKTPWRFALGSGWIPNRFFRMGLSLLFVGPTDDTALLSDTNRLVGQNTVIQPRIGGTYRAIEYKEFTTDAYAGSYYEVSRVADTGSRLHVTGGVEASFWIFTAGLGIDLSSGYKNAIYSVGLDMARVLKKMDLVPTSPVPNGGTFPTPFLNSDADLPRSLVKNWAAVQRPTTIDIAKELPERVEKKAAEAENLVKKEAEAIKKAIKKKPEQSKAQSQESQAVTPTPTP